MPYRIKNSLTQLLLFFLVTICSYTFAVDPTLEWKTIESEHFVIHFNPENKALAIKAAKIAEYAHARLSVELNWSPEEKTEFIISDESDLANGNATPIYANRSTIFLTKPQSTSQLEDYDDWLTTLITHEYTHILHLDKVKRSPAALRNVFGRFLLSFPNLFEPGWMIEGLATYKETDRERGIGRGQSSLYAMMMRMEVEKGIKPVSQVNLPIRTWPGGAARYLYGVYFMNFIADHYGEEKLQQFIEEYSDNLIPFYMNTTFKKVYGKDVVDVWEEYETYLYQEFVPQIEEIAIQGIKEGAAITTEGFNNRSVQSASNSIYYIRNDGTDVPQLVKQMKNGNTEDLLKVDTLATFSVHKTAGVLISQLEICDEYGIYYDLYIYNEVAKRLKRITECGRYISADWTLDGKNIIAVKQYGGKHELHLLNANGELEKVLWKANNDETISGIDVSRDGGKVITAMWKPDTGWNLELFDLITLQWHQLTNGTSIVSHPSFSANDKNILFSCEYKSVYNICSLDLNNQKVSRLTNVLGGAFQPVQNSNEDEIYYTSYSGAGLDIYQLTNTGPIENISIDDGKKFIAYDYGSENHEYEVSNYNPWYGFKPTWWFPHILITEDETELGIVTAGNNAIGSHGYFLNAAVDSENDWMVGSFSYTYMRRLSLSFGRNNNLIKDALGDFNRSRPTDFAQVSFSIPHTKIFSSMNTVIAVGVEKDFDGKLAPTATPVPEFEDNFLALAWTYSNALNYPLSISLNDGRSIRLVAETSDAIKSDFTGQVYTLDWHEYIRLGGEHVLAFRLLQGFGTETPANFQLGGEDSGVAITELFEPVGPPLIGRRTYPLRGYEEGLPQLTDRRIKLMTAEWRFPIKRVERGFMAPPLGLMQWSGSLFVDSGAAYSSSAPDTYYTSAGIEFNSDINLFYFINLRARLGYAHGFDNLIGDDRVYFSLGSSF